METDIYTVYVLYSKKSNIFYTGFTSNLIKRFHEYNSFNLTGFTVKHRPWVVFYTEILYSKTEAIKREKFLKSGQGRQFLKNDIPKIYTQFIS